MMQEATDLSCETLSVESRTGNDARVDGESDDNNRNGNGDADDDDHDADNDHAHDSLARGCHDDDDHHDSHCQESSQSVFKSINMF